MAFPTQTSRSPLISGAAPNINGLDYVIHDGVVPITSLVGSPRRDRLVVAWNGATPVTIQQANNIRSVTGSPIVIDSSQMYAVFAFANGIFWELGRGSPLSGSFLTISKTSDVGDGSTATFVFISAGGLSAAQIEVFVDGLDQEPGTDYTVTTVGQNLNVTFVTPPSAGANIRFRAYRMA